MAGAPSGGAARFSCPPNFTATSPSSESARFSLEALTGPDTELWLIQAPVDFVPDCLNGRLVPLSGSQVVKGKVAGRRHRYRVLSSGSPHAGDATLLAPSAEAEGGLTCAPAPKGSLRILEGPRESSSGIPLHPIPTSPPPQIPPGLRPRFCAFGGSPPVPGPGAAVAPGPPASARRKRQRHVSEAAVPRDAVNGPGTLEGDTAVGSSGVDAGKKKKKQRPSELQAVKPEPEAEGLEPLGVLLPSPSKKKQQLKEADTGELELVIKTEPLQEPVLTPAKRRKRHKGTGGTEAVEGVAAEPQPQVKEEPQEEAIPLPSSKKKKKKEKGCGEPGTEAVEPEMRTRELPGETVEPELPLGETEPQAEAALASTKKRKKKEKWQSPMVEPKTEVVAPQEEEMPEPPLNPESGEGAPTRREKKRKKLQQEPA
uniref:DNA-directed RNA polymerase I subunit RPA34 n=1 Tax=Pipistrellus kuhlii TaxID=59472 RepID=A0A7J7S0C4_PIPKU|nr:hypothetical protein mPipKuh1_002414 [Pipistrellus kuhlii]